MFRFPREPLAPIDEPTIDDDLGGGDPRPNWILWQEEEVAPFLILHVPLTIKSFTRTINIAYNGSGSSTIYCRSNDYGSGIASVTLMEFKCYTRWINICRY